MNDQEKTKEQLLDDLHILKRALETLHVGVTIVDTEGKIIYANRAEAEMHGYNKDDLPGEDVGIYAVEEFRKPMDVQEIMQLKMRIRETYNIRKDKTTFPVQLISDVIKNEAEKPVAIVTVSENITVKKQLEQALQESKGNFQRLMEISPIPVLIYDDKKILDANSAAERLLGYPKKEIMTKAAVDIVQEDYKKSFNQLTEKLLDQKEIHSTFALKVVDNNEKAQYITVSAGLIQVQDRTVIIATFNQII